MEKILSLLTRISELYNIPQWIVDSGAITICIILVAFPFVARYLMRPKYSKFRELILFKVLWRWKYKKGDVIGLWCYCPKCQSMLMCDDENCRSTDALQNKITYFICHECGGNELGRVVGGDRRYVVSLVRRDIWRHIRNGSYSEVSSATKEALDIYAKLEEAKAENNTEESAVLEEKAESLETLIERSSEEAPQETIDANEGDLKEDDADLASFSKEEIPPLEKDDPTQVQEEPSTENTEAVIHEEKEEIKKDGI